MTVEEIKKAIESKQIIEFTWGLGWRDWGTLTCLSDDETTVYYQRHGTGIARGCCPIEMVE